MHCIGMGNFILPATVNADDDTHGTVSSLKIATAIFTSAHSSLLNSIVTKGCSLAGSLDKTEDVGWSSCQDEHPTPNAADEVFTDDDAEGERDKTAKYPLPTIPNKGDFEQSR